MPCEDCEALGKRIDCLFAEDETLCAALEDANTEIEQLIAALNDANSVLYSIMDTARAAMKDIDKHI